MTHRSLDRSDLIARARDGRFPVFIIGAGINGLGVFRDLSLQGVDCLIIDRGDFCGGTSAAPSRMIHGGLKYLETGEFRLVREATLERNLLMRNAPHLVHALETVVPVPSAFGGGVAAIRRFLGFPARLAERGFAIVAAGLLLYDFLGRRERQLPGHRLLRRSGLRRLIPGINGRFVGGAVYYDAAITLPERLGLELALDGMAANPGSVALNHVSLEGHHAGRVRLRDRLSRTEIEIEPEVVVNAAGPWIDRVNERLGPVTRHIGGTKGSHLILDRPDLLERLAGKMVYFESQDGRICLVYPYLGRVLLGSTDISTDDPDAARCDDTEVAYMLTALNSIFPDVEIAPQEIVYRFCGVRPLPRADGREPGEVTRDHSMPITEAGPERPFPVIAMVGGKWTTFRAFAELAADTVLKRVGRPRKASTRGVAIGGGAEYPSDPETYTESLVARYGITAHRAARLLGRYGTAAESVARFCRNRQDAPLENADDYTQREIHYLAEAELVGRLSDIVFCRTSLAVTGCLNSPLVDEISRIAASALGWSEDRRRDEVKLLLASLADSHAMDLSDTVLAEGRQQ